MVMASMKPGMKLRGRAVTWVASVEDDFATDGEGLGG